MHQADYDRLVEPEPLVGAVRRVDALRPPAADLRVERAGLRKVAGVQLEVHDGAASRRLVHHAASSNAGTARTAACRSDGRRPGSPRAATIPARESPAAPRIAGVNPSMNADGAA